MTVRKSGCVVLMGWVFAVGVQIGASKEAAAEEKPYFGIDAVVGSVDEKEWASAEGVPAVQVRAGTDLTPYFGIEARLLAGVDGADGDLTASALAAVNSVEYSFNYAYSLFLKPQLELSNSLQIYGLLGFGAIEVVTKLSGGPLGGGSRVARDNLPGYGAGLVLGLPGKLQWSLDYIAYPGFEDDSSMTDTDVQAISLGFRCPVN